VVAVIDNVRPRKREAATREMTPEAEEQIEVRHTGQVGFNVCWQPARDVESREIRAPLPLPYGNSRIEYEVGSHAPCFGTRGEVRVQSSLRSRHRELYACGDVDGLEAGNQTRHLGKIEGGCVGRNVVPGSLECR